MSGQPSGGHRGPRWRLEQRLGGAWVQVGQGVEGNDSWQARFDEGAGSYELAFDVDTDVARWLRLDR